MRGTGVLQALLFAAKAFKYITHGKGAGSVYLLESTSASFLLPFFLKGRQ